MDSKQITVEIKTVYGNELIYPICDQAKLFAELAGTKTLTLRQISLIKQLGYTVTARQKITNL
jgi:hypothetical protein